MPLSIVNLVFSTLFITTGVLNMFLVHPVPGLFYIFLSLLYFPITDTVIQKKVGFSIPPTVKIVMGTIVIWGTLAVGDLAEVLGL